MDKLEVAGIFMYIIIAVCFLGTAYAIGHENGLRSECNRGGGILIDMRCIDKSFLLNNKHKGKESNNGN